MRRVVDSYVFDTQRESVDGVGGQTDIRLDSRAVKHSVSDVGIGEMTCASLALKNGHSTGGELRLTDVVSIMEVSYLIQDQDFGRRKIRILK